MTGHPDHQAVSRWTLDAIGDDVRVHFATNTPEWLAAWRPRLDAVGAFMGAEPPCSPVEELSIHCVADGDVLEAKYAAITSQISQVEPMFEVFGVDELRTALAEEAFRAARVRR